MRVCISPVFVKILVLMLSMLNFWLCASWRVFLVFSKAGFVYSQNAGDGLGDKFLLRGLTVPRTLIVLPICNAILAT